MTPWRQIALAHDDDACRLAAWLTGCGLTPGQAADLLYGTYVAPAVEEGRGAGGGADSADQEGGGVKRHRCSLPTAGVRRIRWHCPECGRCWTCVEESIPVPPALWGRSVLGMTWESAGAARWRRVWFTRRQMTS